MVLRHGSRIELLDLDARSFGLQELLEAVLGSAALAAGGHFQTREVGGSARNEPHPTLNREPVLRGRIIEGQEGIALNGCGLGNGLRKASVLAPGLQFSFD